MVETDRLRTITLNVDPEVREVSDLVRTDDLRWITVESNAISGVEFDTHRNER